MFTSFDENKFRQAIKEKDFIRLKTNTVSAILQDPSFAKGEAMQVIEILKKEVPEIFEEEIDLGYEERLEPAQWDKRYFTKLTYWLEENFAISRIAYIEEVGKAITTGSAASTPQTKPAVKKPVERTPIEDMIAPIKEENPVVFEKEPVKVSVQEEKVPVVTEKVVEEKPVEAPVIKKTVEIPAIKKPAESLVQKEEAPVKPVVNPTPAPKKKSKLPIIVAGVAAVIAIAVIAIILITGLPQ